MTNKLRKMMSLLTGLVFASEKGVNVFVSRAVSCKKTKNVFCVVFANVLVCAVYKTFQLFKGKGNKKQVLCFEFFAVKSYLSTLHCFRPLCQA